MFVLKTTYQALMRAAVAQRADYNGLLRKYNRLVTRVNDKGGEEFLTSTPSNETFNPMEIKQLLTLCHPDKHKGKQVAVELTQKLLKLRKDA